MSKDYFSFIWANSLWVIKSNVCKSEWNEFSSRFSLDVQTSADPWTLKPEPERIPVPWSEPRCDPPHSWCRSLSEISGPSAEQGNSDLKNTPGEPPPLTGPPGNAELRITYRWCRSDPAGQTCCGPSQTRLLRASGRSCERPLLLSERKECPAETGGAEARRCSVRSFQAQVDRIGSDPKRRCGPLWENTSSHASGSAEPSASGGEALGRDPADLWTEPASASTHRLPEPPEHLTNSWCSCRFYSQTTNISAVIRLSVFAKGFHKCTWVLEYILQSYLNPAVHPSRDPRRTPVLYRSERACETPRTTEPRWSARPGPPLVLSDEETVRNSTSFHRGTHEDHKPGFFLDFSCPSCPRSLQPQVYTVPSSSRKAVCLRPHPTSRTRFPWKNSHFRGSTTISSSIPPKPSWP